MCIYEKQQTNSLNMKTPRDKTKFFLLISDYIYYIAHCLTNRKQRWQRENEWIGEEAMPK